MATKNSAPAVKAAATKAANKAAAAAPVKTVAAKKVPDAKTAPAKKVPVKVTKPETVQASDEDTKVAADMSDQIDHEQDGETIGRKELAAAVYADMKEAGFAAPEKLCVQLVQSFEKAVQAKIAEGVTVVLPGFGKFKTSLRAAGERRNPRSGESMTVAASWAVGFKPGKALKDAANSRPAA